MDAIDPNGVSTIILNMFMRDSKDDYEYDYGLVIKSFNYYKYNSKCSCEIPMSWAPIVIDSMSKLIVIDENIQFLDIGIKDNMLSIPYITSITDEDKLVEMNEIVWECKRKVFSLIQKKADDMVRKSNV